MWRRATLGLGALLLLLASWVLVREQRSGPPASPSASRVHPASVAYRFSVHDSRGRPARWDPCSPVQVKVSREGAPAGALGEMRAAVAHVEAVTGLAFRLRTVPRTRSGDARDLMNGRLMRRQVLLAFTDPADDQLRDPGASAETATSWIPRRDGRLQYVSATMLFNVRHAPLYGHGDDGRPSWQRLFEHELGHLLGLGHVRDTRSIMNPWIVDRHGMSRGDTFGLKRLGSGPCMPAPGAP